ncbi:hypothetical protein DFH06DRAFT_443181 [Mycena polygramma]|nr:hypothetical protein DFH06DRAFT_443181 [Mycena polygramma]
MHLYEMAFKGGYEAVVSRASLSRRLLRICAKKHPNGTHVERRAKTDTQFCSILATIICTRGGNLKTALRNGATSKVATHYELNKNTTPSQIRSMVKQLLHEQRYILPYAAAPARSTATPDNVDAAAVTDDNTAAATNKNTPAVPDKITLTFIPDMPFLAPAVVDLIRETWWNTAKALGFKHVSELVSYRTDRPRDIVLPDAMIGLAVANVWAAIVSYLLEEHACSSGSMLEHSS